MIYKDRLNKSWEDLVKWRTAREMTKLETGGTRMYTIMWGLTNVTAPSRVGLFDPTLSLFDPTLSLFNNTSETRLGLNQIDAFSKMTVWWGPLFL